LLRVLLEPLPEESLHASKRLLSIKQVADKLEVAFEDGTVETFDAVIGADGIHGRVRNHVLGGDAQAHCATAAGFWTCGTLAPYDKAIEKLGEQYFEQDRQTGWLGQGAFLMHDICEDGKMVQCVVVGSEAEAPADRKRPITREGLEDLLADWLHGPVARGMIDASLPCLVLPLLLTI
jgi:salicylate hydroxylase